MVNNTWKAGPQSLACLELAFGSMLLDSVFLGSLFDIFVNKCERLEDCLVSCRHLSVCSKFGLPSLKRVACMIIIDLIGF